MKDVTSEDTILRISPERTISELQKDFARNYPFLKIDFYRNKGNFRDRLAESARLIMIGIKKSGIIKISHDTTVGFLEEAFRTCFDLNVQVSRQSGRMWLETTMTDNWTLKQQNDHGMELSS